MKRKGVRLIKYLIVFGLCCSVVYLMWSLSEINDYETKNNVNEPSSIGDPLQKIDWHDYKSINADIARVGPGEQGSGVTTENGDKKDRLFQENGFNALASDKISLNRSLNDIRHRDCKYQKYQRLLPTVSIIIPFYNEHWSTLLRTFISAINRSPKQLLKEIILVDDASTKDFLKDQLDEYLRKNYPKGFVRVLRQKKREGLIRTRLLGARNATGDVLIFLDSHCESNINWLPPLLDPIAQDYRTVVCPFIDVIAHDDFSYKAQDEGARGAFDWEFFYKRIPLLPKDLEHPAQPFESPVMAGGLFAISSKWFWELGGYDPGLDIWGGEQYELSFKIWQCGGRMVDAPCSRIGHVYRKFSPFPSPKGIGDFIGRNFKRVAEVWMDDWKEYIYNRRPQYRNLHPGDLTEQHAIRKRLQCKPFDWFMREIAFDLTKHYPAVEPELSAFGDLRSQADESLCIDTKMHKALETFGLAKCIRDGKDVDQNGEQNLELTFRGEIKPRRRNVCFDSSVYKEEAPIVLYDCHKLRGNQEFKYNPYTHLLIHKPSNRCVEANTATLEIYLMSCDESKLSHKWKWEKFNVTQLKRLLN